MLEACRKDTKRDYARSNFVGLTGVYITQRVPPSFSDSVSGLPVHVPILYILRYDKNSRVKGLDAT